MFDQVLNSIDPDMLWGKKTPAQIQLLDNWRKFLKIDNLDITPFRDADFLSRFVEIMPPDEWINYVRNTNEYHTYYDGKRSKDYDPRYVLVTRRAVPSEKGKPEPYWSDEHSVARLGLKREMPQGSSQRIHSEIMVTTLGKLINHGLDIKTDGGHSDGEIMIDSSKPFVDILFSYKPENEKLERDEYLNNGGESKETVLRNLENRYQPKPESETTLS